MEINVDEENRFVGIWLTKAEAGDVRAGELLQPLYKKYHAEKYKVGVLLSGGGDVLEGTKNLLLNNRLG